MYISSEYGWVPACHIDRLTYACVRLFVFSSEHVKRRARRHTCDVSNVMLVSCCGRVPVVVCVRMRHVVILVHQRLRKDACQNLVHPCGKEVLRNLLYVVVAMQSGPLLAMQSGPSLAMQSGPSLAMQSGPSDVSRVKL